MIAEKRVTFTNDYNKRRGPSHGSGQFTYNNTGNRNQAGRDITDTQQLTYDGATQFHPRSKWCNPPRNNTFNSTLVADDRSIDIRISSLTGMMTTTIGKALPEPRREGTGRKMGAIHVLLLVRDETHSRIDSINPRGLVHVIYQCSVDLTAKKPAVLFLMNSGSLEPMSNLALTQSDLPLRTIQSMHYPTSAH